MLKKFDKTLLKLELVFCEVLIVVLVLVVFMNAVLRLFKNPISWSTDVAQLIFAWISFVGADMALKKDKHAGVDIITSRLSPKVTRILSIVTYIAIIVFLVIIGRAGAGLAIKNINRKFHSMPISYSSVTFSVPVGCLLMGYTCVRKLMQLIGKTPDPYKDELEDPEIQEEEEL
ncbi:MAG: TRAP transporter small permease [Clostridia bacterium]|nr:TRAP transporter small permease [Clostridia bacterium]